MNYSGFLDNDSNNIICRYQYIKEGLKKPQTINEVLPLIPAVAGAAVASGGTAVGASGLLAILGAIGISGTLLYNLQQILPLNFIKQFGNIVANLKKEFDALEAATTNEELITGLNSLAALISSLPITSAKRLSLVFTNLSRLVNDINQDKVTEDVAYKAFFDLQSSFNKIVYSNLGSAAYNSNPAIASIQRQLAKIITAEISKSAEEELNKFQEVSKLLKRNVRGAPEPQPPQEPPQEPQKPKEPKEPKESWIKKIISFIKTWIITPARFVGKAVKWVKHITLVLAVLVLFDQCQKITGQERTLANIPGATTASDAAVGATSAVVKGAATSTAQAVTGPGYLQRKESPETIRKKSEEKDSFLRQLGF